MPVCVVSFPVCKVVSLGDTLNWHFRECKQKFSYSFNK